MLRPQAIHETTETARTAQAWKDRHAIRAGIESTIHQAVTRTGVRRNRYTGLPKTHLSHVFTAAAINIIPLEAWWTDTQPQEKTTRTSHLSCLVLATWIRQQSPTGDEVILDLIYGPMWCRLLVGHGPLDDAYARELAQAVATAAR